MIYANAKVEQNSVTISMMCSVVVHVLWCCGVVWVLWSVCFVMFVSFLTILYSDLIHQILTNCLATISQVYISI